jgi:hypothetical protein
MVCRADVSQLPFIGLGYPRVCSTDLDDLQVVGIFAVLWNPTVPGIAVYAMASQAAGRGLGVVFQSVEVREPHDLDTAFATLVQDRPGPRPHDPATPPLPGRRADPMSLEVGASHVWPRTSARMLSATPGGTMARGYGRYGGGLTRWWVVWVCGESVQIRRDYGWTIR